jgi:hypothetical protein
MIHTLVIDRASAVRRGKRLEYATVAYNSVEGLTRGYGCVAGGDRRLYGDPISEDTRAGWWAFAVPVTNWKASPTTTRTCRLRRGSARGNKRDIRRRKATVDDFVAAQSLQAQQGSTSFNRPSPSH